jgi:hypothetical protein
MITIEQYYNLSNHIKYVNNNVQTIMTKEPVAADGEVTGRNILSIY